MLSIEPAANGSVRVVCSVRLDATEERRYHRPPSAEDETKAATKGILFRKEAVQVSLLEKAAQQNSRTIAQLVRALP